MRALFLSGGAFKLVSLVSASIDLIHVRKYKPQLLAGSSSGAITALMVCVNKLQLAEDISIKIKVKDVFDRKPFNEDGDITFGAVLRFFRGFVTKRHNYLGTIGNLDKLLRKHVTKEEFTKYQQSTDTPIALVFAIDANTKQRKIWNLKEVNYDIAIKAVLASSSIAGIMPAVEINGSHYYDGGYRDHNPGGYLLAETEYGDKIKSFVSVYTRPQKHSVKYSTKWRNNFITALLDFSLSALNMEVSKGDEYMEFIQKGDKKIKGYQIFIEPFLDWGFDTNKEHLQQGKINAIKAVEKYYQ